MAMLYRMPEEDERHVLFLEEEGAIFTTAG